MKLSSVLYKFLAANKKLSLPGIGTFHSDSAYDPDYDGKKAVLLNNITYSEDKVDGFDDALVEFVSKETGKMKVLATSDLTSQLDDVLQFINTGKPYFFPGIGTIAKKTNGSLEFFPEKHTSHNEKKKAKDVPITEKNYVPQSYIDNTKTRNKSFKPAIIILTLALIAIAATVWFYIKNQEDTKKQVEDVTNNTETTTPALPVNDSNNVATKDSVVNTTVAPSSSDTYTYVLETANEPRASKRFNQLKQISWPVELEVIDSLNKRIVMKLPRAGADTTRIKDSLRVLSGKKIFIVQ